MYLFAFMCLETDNGSGMLCCLFGNIFLQITIGYRSFCLLYTSDAADEEDSGVLGGRRILIKKKKKSEEREEW